MLNIIHLIDTISKVNYGIWSAALINSHYLKNKNINSFAFFPDQEEFIYDNVETHSFNDKQEIFSFLKAQKLNTSNTIIISHGCWRWPTKLGFSLKKKGYRWIAVPHGMLEPWSMDQKKIKKKIYFNLLEKRLLQKADRIRAVSRPEFLRLRDSFGKSVIHIPNGVNSYPKPIKKPHQTPIRFLFMARLHHKKGVLPLLEGWLLSPLANNKNYELQIAGPDDGELKNILPLIDKCSNIKYLGAVYKEEKNSLLMDSHVYLLPSYSEGFPSSVLEAMDFGLLPLISKGCNFPEAFDKNLVVNIEPEAEQIARVLKEVSDYDMTTIIKKGLEQKKFILNNYTNEIISDKLYDLINGLL